MIYCSPKNGESISSVADNAKASSSGLHSSKVNTCDNTEITSSKCYKSTRGKNIYYHRQKQLDLDTDKLEVLRGLKETLEDCKKVQKENVLIWTEKIGELTQAYKERNEILKKIADSQK